MKKLEWQQMTIYYCDNCGKRCGLPYSVMNGVGYGKCCSSIKHKICRKKRAIKEIREQPWFTC